MELDRTHLEETCNWCDITAFEMESPRVKEKKKTMAYLVEVLTQIIKRWLSWTKEETVT